MSNYPSGPFGFAPGQTLGYRSREEELTVGQFFNGVYAWMAVGLAVTAAVAFGVANYGSLSFLNMGTFIILFIAQIALVSVISRAVNRIGAGVATALFLLYAALNGVTLSILFLIYTHAALASAFIITAGMFGAMSIYGYITKRDLTRLGSLLFMALIGIIIASLVNMFARNAMMGWIINYAAVIIFVGLIAFDTQRLKAIAIQTSSNAAMSNRMAVVGSLILYLDFINLFIYILRIMNDRRR